MEVFESIDWKTSLNDIIDDEFVDIDILENESVMYNILKNTYSDPLKNFHTDNYHLVTQEHLDYVREREKNKNEKALQLAVEQEKKKKAKYVPGILKKPFYFPRTSSLSEEEQALCLRVILKFSSSEKQATNAQSMNELRQYMDLKSVIAKEQDEYLEMAKKNWDGSNIKIVREDLINIKWNAKLKQLQRLHKFYNLVGAIAFASNETIHINFISTVLKTGQIPKLRLPSFKHRYTLNVINPMIQTTYFQNIELEKENYVYQDKNCNELAKSHDVDLVISSSGLNCLATNLNPNHNNTWILPVVIKNYESKNIIFIDKPLPSTAKNVIEKNTWIYKYILKYYVINNSNKQKNHLDDPDPTFDISSDFDGTLKKETERNAQYNLFTIGACGSLQNELMKNKISQDYKILVRTKIDAIEELEDEFKGNIKIVPKLEFQTALGAEAVTLEEAAKQWISLTFTPDTYVFRVRIDHIQSELLQVEKRTTSSINNELNRLYNLKGENILIFLYNIIANMRQLSPGRYLLRHTLRDGGFANIYEATDSPEKNSINLENIYCEDTFRTIPNAPWPTLDKMVPTPAMKFFNRMPAMFYPKVKSSKIRKNKMKQVLDNKDNMTKTKAKSSTQKKRKKQKLYHLNESDDIIPDQS